MHSSSSNLQVLYEDNHLIIINKRIGDIVQGDITKDPPLSDIVKEFIKVRDKKPGNVFLGVVHRLDRPTSGIVMFAKTSKALIRINKMLRAKEITKTYWAMVKNQPTNEQMTLVHYLKKNPKNNKSTAFKNPGNDAKKSILHFIIKKKLQTYYLLEINLETGRHHQIRCQLASIGSPIKGDLKYGFDRSNKNGGIHLHARKIQFIHPVNQNQIKVIAPTPFDPVWDACL